MNITAVREGVSLSRFIYGSSFNLHYAGRQAIKHINLVGFYSFSPLKEYKASLFEAVPGFFASHLLLYVFKS